MALLSDATIVVEASETKGTRHQVWEALRLGGRSSLYYLGLMQSDEALSLLGAMTPAAARIRSNKGAMYRISLN